MLVKSLNRKLGLLKKSSQLFSQVPAQQTINVPQAKEGSQFSKERLVEFGELPIGEIPNDLKISPVFNQTSLNNKAQIVTERYTSNENTVSIFLRAGSRFENLNSSGSARLLTNLFVRGTEKKNRQQLEEAIANLGGQLNITFERDVIGLSLTVTKEDVTAATQLLCEMVFERNTSEQAVEQEKLFVQQQAKEISRDQHQFTIEGLFYTSFRENMLGQPSNGNRDTVHKLTSDDVQSHIDRTFCGKNFAIVATGDVNHNQVVDAASSWLNKLPVEPKQTQEQEKAYLTPSMMSQRDDELENVNISVAYAAPAYSSPYSLTARIYKEILGDYNANDNGAAHLNTADRQYNKFHAYLGDRPGINLAKIDYYGYEDIGLFTCWLHAHELYSLESQHFAPFMLGQHTKGLNQVEAFRARAKIFNQLLDQRPSESLNVEIAKNVFYLGRRLNRTETASRISHMSEAKFLRDYGRNWFFDKDTCLNLFGNLHRSFGFDVYGMRHLYATRGDKHVVGF